MILLTSFVIMNAMLVNSESENIPSKETHRDQEEAVSEDKKKYITEKLNPLLEDLVRHKLISLPDEPIVQQIKLHGTVGGADANGANDANERAELQAKIEALKAENAKIVGNIIADGGADIAKKDEEEKKDDDDEEDEEEFSRSHRDQRQVTIEASGFEASNGKRQSPSGFEASNGKDKKRSFKDKKRSFKKDRRSLSENELESETLPIHKNKNMPTGQNRDI